MNNPPTKTDRIQRRTSSYWRSGCSSRAPPSSSPQPRAPAFRTSAAGLPCSLLLNLRLADIQEVYQQWRSHGAESLTPPIDWEAEIRCYIRDPDGHLIEVGQATGFLAGLEEGG